MRRLAIGLLVAAASFGLAQSAFADGPVTPAQEPSPADELAPVDVFEVSGLLDGIVADEIERAIDRAAEDGAQALVLQVNSKQAVVSRERMIELAEQIRDSEIPVAVWVGPSGARAYGLPGQLIGAAPIAGMAPGARIGEFGRPLELSDGPLDFGDAIDELATGTLGYDEARASGVLKLPNDAPDAIVLRTMLQAMDGVEYRGTVLDTVVDVATDDSTVESTATTPRFFKLGLVPRLFHTVASPPVAYLLFVIGAALLVFEFFTAGVGVAGVVGVTCFVLGSYGFGVLPMRGWALVLLILAILALAIDVQVGIPRFWTGFGLLAFTLASVALYRDGIRMSWITLVAGVGGMALAFIVGMPSMVRTRFATPTIGREWMIGQTGAAVVDLAPDGVVKVGEGTWRARTNRATPVAAGDVVRVVAIDGVTLEVEPESGGARDYRERRAKTPEAEAPAVD